MNAVALRLALAWLLLAAGPVSAQSFVFGLPAEPVQLDPAVVSDGPSLLVISQLYGKSRRTRR